MNEGFNFAKIKNLKDTFQGHLDDNSRSIAREETTEDLEVENQSSFVNNSSIDNLLKIHAPPPSHISDVPPELPILKANLIARLIKDSIKWILKDSSPHSFDPVFWETNFTRDKEKSEKSSQESSRHLFCYRNNKA